MSSGKRPRRASSSSSVSSDASTWSTSSRLVLSDDGNTASPALKFARAESSGSPSIPQYTCTLGPTCDPGRTAATAGGGGGGHGTDGPRTFSTMQAFESHYRTYHSFVCHARTFSREFESERARRLRRPSGRAQVGTDGAADLADECGRVFPTERMLELHLREWHDSVWKVKEERGERIYECFDEHCGHWFATPKGRRLHLVDKHAYPKEFFFGVVIHGVEDVLDKGGGLLKKEWKSRGDVEAGGEKDKDATDVVALGGVDKELEPGRENDRHRSADEHGSKLSEVEEMMGKMALQELVPRPVARKRNDRDKRSMAVC